jgi:hypothetical protein
LLIHPLIPMRRSLALSSILLTLVILTGCQQKNALKTEHSTSAAIQNAFAASGNQRVDLATVVPGDWERVCIVGPYGGNQAAVEKMLGFPWNVAAQSRIGESDAISLLLFVKGSQVVSHIDHSRQAGDFSNLNQRCFARSQAQFVQVTQPKRGWPGLFPVGEP